MQWEEVIPPPEECRACDGEDCYNCDFAGKRWRLSRRYELNLKRKGVLKSIERLEKQLNAINEELSRLQEKGDE